MNDRPIEAPTIRPPGVFFGRQESVRKAGWLSLQKTRWDPEEDTPWHSHETAFFHYVTDGTCQERLHKDRANLRSGTLIYHPAGEEHANCWPSGGSCLHIEVDPFFLERWDTKVVGGSNRGVFTAGLPTWIAQRMLGEFRATDSAAVLSLQGLALELVAETLRTHDAVEVRVPKWLNKVREILEESPSSPYSLDSLAEEVAIHPAHLARSFRRAYSCSVGQYVRKLRIDIACRALCSGVESLSGLASDLGFADQSHFTRVFKRQIGLTPAEFQRAFGK